MKTYNIICPLCGHLNRNLYLDETGGWMECENCSELSMHYNEPVETRKLPVFHVDEVGKIKNYLRLHPSLQAGS